MHNQNELEAGFHNVIIYNGKNRPEEGCRLSVITFKTPSDKKDDPEYKRPDARCVSVPKLTLSCTPQIVGEALLQALEDLQDAVIRSIVVAAISEGKNVINVHDDQISYEAIAEYAKQQAAGGKINKDLIEQWFDESLADKLTLALADAMKVGDKPTPEQEKKIADAVTMYKDVFKQFSAPKAGVSPRIAKQMQKALEHAENKEDRVYKALALKLAAHAEQQDPNLIGL